MGSNFHHEGVVPKLLEGMEGDDSMLRAPYEAVSPDGPEHWPVITEKLVALWRVAPTLTVDDLARIPVPVLVLVGDDDAVFLSHTVAMYEALPQGQLAVIPGTSHLVPIEKPALVNQLVLDFLDDGAVVSMIPMRRSG
jgi:pimeloyl-ACP methyl ester carboxylesterase